MEVLQSVMGLTTVPSVAQKEYKILQKMQIPRSIVKKKKTVWKDIVPLQSVFGTGFETACFCSISFP